MDTKNALVAVTANTKPPVSRRQLLMATAEAMADEHNAVVDAVSRLREKLTKQRNAKLEKLARRKLATAVVGVRTTWDGDYHVEFAVTIPKSDVAEESAALAANPAMTKKMPEDFMKKLRAATVSRDDRVQALLADPKIRGQLIAAGQALIDGKAKADAIPV